MLDFRDVEARRAALYARLMEGGPHSPERSEKASKLIDDYTHALAEVQRDAIGNTDDPVFYEGEAGWLPNLIDPAVVCPPGCDCDCHVADTSPCDDCTAA
jgi:hypothetical protein